MSSDGGMLYYRKDLLDKAGIAAAEDLGRDDHRLREDQGTPQGKNIGCYAGQFEKYEGLTVNFSEAINSAGGVVVDDDGKPNVDTPEALAGLTSWPRASRGLHPEGRHHLQGRGRPPGVPGGQPALPPQLAVRVQRWPARPTARRRSPASSRSRRCRV